MRMDSKQSFLTSEKHLACSQGNYCDLCSSKVLKLDSIKCERTILHWQGNRLHGLLSSVPDFYFSEALHQDIELILCVFTWGWKFSALLLHYLTAFNINSNFPVLMGGGPGICSTLALDNTETFCLLLKGKCCIVTTWLDTAQEVMTCKFTAQEVQASKHFLYFTCVKFKPVATESMCQKRLLHSVKTTADVPLTEVPGKILLFSFYK